MESNPYSLRTPYPQSWPQYPFDVPPAARESSQPTFGIQADLGVRVRMRDGVHLAMDVFRPSGRPGQQFPALVGFGPYTRQLQQTDAPYGQNEGGIKEFWVPRGYAMVMVDVRGSNDSEGEWDMFGATERADFPEVIEWVAAQPWCDGNVGMTGASYYGRTQLMTAEEQPPSLRAIFAYDAATDAYRDTFFHGGIPNEAMQRNWFARVVELNTRSGRQANGQAIVDRWRSILAMEHAFDGDYYQSRSSWPRLDEIDVPVYFACRWTFHNLHLRGAFKGWQGTGDVPKRMLIGPDPQPPRPISEYHLEMLRWYDHWLKGMDTGVMDGDPIQLWLPGPDRWRSETRWPLEGTRWTPLYLGGPDGGLDAGTLAWTSEAGGDRTYDVDALDPGWLRGSPRLVYRTAPLTERIEATGPVQLDLWLASSGTDTDVLVTLHDEAPDGSSRLLTRGWLRASHRAVDESRSRPNEPWHPHTSAEPLTPGEPALLPVELIPMCAVMEPGHRLRLEIASSDDVVMNSGGYHRTLMNQVTNTVFEGGDRPSVLTLPLVDRN